MQITLFGAIWLVMLFFCFFSNDHRKILFLTLFAMVFQCDNVVVLGGTGIGVQIFTVGIAWVRLWIVKRAADNGKKAAWLAWLCFALFFAVVISLLFNRSMDTQRQIGMAMIFVYAVFLLTLSRKAIQVDDEWLERTENVILTFVLIVGFLQVLCKSGVSILTAPLRLFIYNDINNSDVIFNYKSLNRFYSTFMEPSYCGAYLVGMFGLIMVRRKVNLCNILLGTLVALAIILTRSSTAYGGMAIIGCILLMTRAKKKVFKLLIPVFFLGMVYIAAYNMDLLNEVIFDKALTGSFRTRITLDRWAILTFRNSPLFGVGYRNFRASSLVFSLLAEVGILGFGLYLLLVAMVLKWAMMDKKNLIAKSRSFFVLGIIVCQFIGCPDLNFSPFWMAMYFLVLSLRLDNIHSIEEGAESP